MSFLFRWQVRDLVECACCMRLCCLIARRESKRNVAGSEMGRGRVPMAGMLDASVSRLLHAAVAAILVAYCAVCDKSRILYAELRESIETREHGGSALTPERRFSVNTSQADPLNLYSFKLCDNGDRLFTTHCSEQPQTSSMRPPCRWLCVSSAMIACQAPGPTSS